MTTVLLLLTTSLQFASLVQANEPEGRVVGGQNADFNEYRFFTSWGRSCGATLIHDDILLTAAHCNPVETNQVVVGAYAKDTPMYNSEIRNIERRIIHPDYNVESWNFDVMLLKIDRPVTNIPKIALNRDTRTPSVASTVTPLGLGRLNEIDGDFPTVLQEVNVRVIDSQVCNRSPMYQGWIQESMVCAGHNGGGLDACYGDSGGPLLQKDSQTGDLLQVGVVSFGTGCARSDKPGVYHRVSSSYDWIQEQICNFSSNKPSTCPGVRDAVVEQIDTEEQEQVQNQQAALAPPPTARPTLPPTLPPTERPTLPPTAKPTEGRQALFPQQQQQQQHQQGEEQQQQQEEEVIQLFTHTITPPPFPLGICEGDCDKDADCGEGLFCFFKTSGVVQRVPGCEGNDSTSTDFCVDIKYRNNSNGRTRQSIFSHGLRGSSATNRAGFNNIGSRTRSQGFLEGVFQSKIP